MKVTRLILSQTLTDAHQLTRPTYKLNTLNSIVFQLRSYRAHGRNDIVRCRDRDAKLAARYSGSLNCLVAAVSWLKRLYFLQDINLR